MSWGLGGRKYAMLIVVRDTYKFRPTLEVLWLTNPQSSTLGRVQDPRLFYDKNLKFGIKMLTLGLIFTRNFRNKHDSMGEWISEEISGYETNVRYVNHSLTHAVTPKSRAWPLCLTQTTLYLRIIITISYCIKKKIFFLIHHNAMFTKKPLIILIIVPLKRARTMSIASCE